MSAEQEVSKDLVFAQPRVPVKRYGYADEDGKTQARDWTVTEVEEVLWRIRASGGTDSTPVVFRQDYGEEHRHLGMTIRAKHVEASPVFEVPRRREPDCKACDDRGVLDGTGKACPVCQQRAVQDQWWYRPARVAGLLLAAPVVASALVLVWRFCLWLALGLG